MIPLTVIPLSGTHCISFLWWLLNKYIWSFSSNQVFFEWIILLTFKIKMFAATPNSLNKGVYFLPPSFCSSWIPCYLSHLFMKEILDCIVDMGFININLDPTAKWVFIVLLSFRSDRLKHFICDCFNIIWSRLCFPSWNWVYLIVRTVEVFPQILIQIKFQFFL